jgi:hypothetical protein
MPTQTKDELEELGQGWPSIHRDAERNRVLGNCSPIEHEPPRYKYF